MFREIKPHEKNLFSSSSEVGAIKSLERDSLGRVTKIEINTDHPEAFNFETVNEVYETAKRL